MSNYDPYEIDSERIIEENTKKEYAKTNWHNIPDGNSTSYWRILPYTQRKSFYFKVQKHWKVPGFNGSVTCPRSFEDPQTPGKNLSCAICDKRWEMFNSNNDADKAFAKEVLNASTSYYANALSIDHPEKGVGILSLPYAVFQHLFNWLTVPAFQSFSHPDRGFDLLIQATVVPGAAIPGQTKFKRNYTITPMEKKPIADKGILATLYDLEHVVGIPTFEFTELCLNRIITGDESLQLPQGIARYRGQLAAGGDDSFEFGDNQTPAGAQTLLTVQPGTATQVPPSTQPPAFASPALPTQKPLTPPSNIEKDLLSMLKGGK
jgi:hypothetical protein